MVSRWGPQRRKQATRRLQNCTKIPPFLMPKFRTFRKKKQPKTLRFKRIRGQNTFWGFQHRRGILAKKWPPTKMSLFLSTTYRPWNPFKTSAKWAEGNPDTSRWPGFPSGDPKMCPGFPSYSTYIYIYRDILIYRSWTRTKMCPYID